MTDSAIAAQIRRTSSLSHSEGSPTESTAGGQPSPQTSKEEQSRSQALANECLSLKEELATSQQRYEAQLENLRKQCKAAIEEAERKSRREVQCAKSETRDYQRRIIDLSKQIAAGVGIQSVTDVPGPGPETTSGSFATTSLRSLISSRDLDIDSIQQRLTAKQQECAMLETTLHDTQARLTAALEREEQRTSSQSSPTRSAELTPQQMSENRELSKRVVGLATELAKAHAERDQATRRADELQRRYDSMKATHDALIRDFERAKKELSQCQSSLITETERDDELKALRNDFARIKATHAECEKREQQFVLFRQQHENCAKTMIDQKARVAALDNQVQRYEVMLADAQRQEKLANDLLLQLKKELAVAVEEGEGWKRRYASLCATKSAEEAERRQETERLRAKIDEETRLRMATKAELDTAHGALAAEQASFTHLEQTLAATRASLELAQARCNDLQHHQQRTQELEATLANIQHAYSTTAQELRRVESERVAAAKDHNERLQALQKKHLELLEVRQHFESRTKEYHKLREEHNALVARTNELEGSYIDGTSSSRRLTGLLESMTVELAQQVADHLRLEFMRGGTKTAALFRRVFNLDLETAKEIVDVLSHLYLMLKANISVTRMCQLVGVKEISVRRIITGFSAVNERYASTPRRSELNRGISFKQVFRGYERLALLCAAETATSTVAQFGKHPLILAKCCSFLTPTLVSGPNFAHHLMVENNGAREGQTVLLKFDSAASEFQMTEARTTAASFAAIQTRGAFEQVDEGEALGTCRIRLVVKVKHFCDDTNRDWTNMELDGEVEVLLTLRWDKRHNGAVVDLPGGGRLHELTDHEAALIEKLFSQDESKMDHASWQFRLGI